MPTHSSRKYEFHPHARAEFLDAVRYYRDEAVGLGALFRAEVMRCVKLVVENPEIAPVIAHEDVRRKPLRGFRYSLIYGVEPDLIRIVAVAHHSRHPDYWASGFALFVGHELERALHQGDSASRFALGLDVEDFDVDESGLALASGARELRLNLRRDLELLSVAPLRGPPTRDLKTRIGGLELFPPFRIGVSERLSLGVQRGYGDSGCELVADHPKDPLGLEDPKSEAIREKLQWGICEASPRAGQPTGTHPVPSPR